MRPLRALRPALLALALLLAGGAALVQAAQAGSSAPADVRQPLAEHQRAAWAAVGQLRLGDAGLCTATLIAPDTLLTAAHCLFGRDNRPWRASRLQFVPGWWQGEGRLQLRGWSVAVGAGFAHDPERPNPEGDIALVRLAQPAPQVLVPFPPASTPAEAGEWVAVLSHVGDGSGVARIQPSCRILGRQGGLLVTDCEALPGVSGAPLLRLMAGEAEVIGVISSRLTGAEAGVFRSVAVALDGHLTLMQEQLAPRD